MPYSCYLSVTRDPFSYRQCHDSFSDFYLDYLALFGVVQFLLMNSVDKVLPQLSHYLNDNNETCAVQLT